MFESAKSWLQKRKSVLQAAAGVEPELSTGQPEMKEVEHTEERRRIRIAVTKHSGSTSTDICEYAHVRRKLRLVLLKQGVEVGDWTATTGRWGASLYWLAGTVPVEDSGSQGESN